MTLSMRERERILAEPHIGALSVVEGPDHAPTRRAANCGNVPARILGRCERFGLQGVSA